MNWETVARDLLKAMQKIRDHSENDLVRYVRNVDSIAVDACIKSEFAIEDKLGERF